MKLTQTIEFYIKKTSLALSRMYNELAKKYGLTQTAGYVLMYVHKEGTPTTQLAYSLGMKESSLTRLLKKMENKGLINRIKDPTDKRIIRVFLTPEGVEKRRLIKKYVLEFNEKIMKNLGEENIQKFYEILDYINEMIQKQVVYQTTIKH